MAFEPFIRRAQWTAKYGVRVVPSYKGYKFCAIPGVFHQATTDREQLEKWNAEDNQYNVIAVPRLGEVAILDIDDPKVLELLPQPLPRTLKVKSPSGGFHIYLKATPESDALGNRNVLRIGDYSVADEKGNLSPLLEMKANNLTTAAPGSLNSDGISYKPVEVPEGNALAPFPAWLADWVKEHGTEARGCSSKLEHRTPHPDFDPYDYFEFRKEQGAFTVGDPIETRADGCHHAKCYVPECGCLYKGAPHEKSERTGFMAYYDEHDNLIGFSYRCFAASCIGEGTTTVTKLDEFIEDEGIGQDGTQCYDRYEYFIYEDEDDGTLFDNDKRFPVDYIENTPETEPEPEAVAVKPKNPIVMDEDVEEVTFVSKKVVDAFNPFRKLPQVTAEDVKKMTGQDEEEEEQPELEPEEKQPNLTELSFQKATKGVRRLFVRPLSDFEAVKVEWLWPERIPIGFVTLFTGRAGCCKTTTMLDMAARVTTGRDWPDAKNTMGPQKVFFCSSEDDPATVLKPRLMAMGADMANVQIIEIRDEVEGKKKSKKKKLNLKEDKALLKAAIKANPEYKVLILDPITSYFGNVDANHDKDMRPLMDDLAELARETGIAIVGLIHNNKRSDVGSATEKVSGATSIAASARMVWGFSRNPDNKDLYRMAQVKNNLSKKRTGLKFTTEDVEITFSNGSKGEQFKIVWDGEIEEDADALMYEERAKAREASSGGGADSKIVMAKAMLQNILPCSCVEVFKRLKDGEGISQATIYRAKDDLKVTAKPGKGGKWWYLPGQDEKSVPMALAAFKKAEQREIDLLNQMADEKY